MNNSTANSGTFFSDATMQFVKDSFYYVDSDLNGRRRFFLIMRVALFV